MANSAQKDAMDLYKKRKDLYKGTTPGMFHNTMQFKPATTVRDYVQRIGKAVGIGGAKRVYPAKPVQAKTKVGR